MSDDGICGDEIKKRIGIAKTTFSKMKDVLKSTKIPLNTRKRILQCYVWSTLLYGTETWTITKVMKTRLEAFELWAYKKDSENIMDREGHKQGSLIKNGNEEASVHHNSN